MNAFSRLRRRGGNAYKPASKSPRCKAEPIAWPSSAPFPSSSLTRKQAEGFYHVHRERKFFGELVDFITGGPVLVMVLEGDNAIAKYREVMGATDPAKAAAGTIRKDLAESIEANSVHGSDAPETAAQEIAYFFAQTDIVG